MWRDVVERLEGAGPRVHIADLPSTNRSDATLADDVAHVRGIAAGDRVVLVGHSYGGAVVTEVAAGRTNVVHLVYVAAFVPDVGESTFDWLTKRPIGGGPDLEFFEDGTSMPRGWGDDNGRYDAEVLARIRATPPRRQAVAPAVTALGAAAWHDVPSTYLVATVDDVLHPESQREMASRAGARTIELESGHLVNFARPEAIAAAIMDVCP
jgi:pimeloyl-ACP methyl ester carboxylesterase